jgi:arylsulfate sulfotransferase
MLSIPLTAALLVAAIPTFASMTVSVAATGKTPLMVGDEVAIAATVAGQDPGNIVYRLSVARGSSPYQVVIDYNHYSSFEWAPSATEGMYSFQVSALNLSTHELATGTAQVNVLSRIVGNQPVITPTGQPLVALYSAPPCPVGSSMYVRFGVGGIVNGTNARPCLANTSMNFYIAGMQASTTYNMRCFVVTGTKQTPGPSLQFTTGVIPASLRFPQWSIPVPPIAQADSDQNVLLMDQISIDSSHFGLYYFPTATDLQGHVIWYYNALANIQQRASYSLRPVAGGTIMLNAADPRSILVRGQIWREIDLAGNTIRETNTTRVSSQLSAKGLYGIIDFDHDSIRLPNGHTLILCTQEKIFPAGTQGYQAPVDILGDAIVDLDQNLQVDWSWSAYDHLNINRGPTLGELCAPNTDGCPPMTLAPLGVDWLHGNSLNYIPASGDLLISLRNQDWIAKLDYKNGTGTGNVLWEMGIGGDFAMNGTGPFPWFSHQHDVEYELNGTTVLSLYDNGDTRVAENPGVLENSRGMVLNVDETNRIVTPMLSQDLGVYCGGVGSAQRLDNGNYHFTSGFINPGEYESALHSEYTIGGVEAYSLLEDVLTYRGYRMTSLYQLDGKGN